MTILRIRAVTGMQAQDSIRRMVLRLHIEAARINSYADPVRCRDSCDFPAAGLPVAFPGGVGD